MNYAIILAGGSGTRFWPLSRKLQPKQFLNLCSKSPMIAETISRISRLIKKENIYIATGSIYKKQILKYAKDLSIPRGNILFEPDSRNTFAPIAVLSKRINDIDPQAVILVLPSDHFIKDKKEFLKILSQAIKSARRGYIVSLGIHPNRPETGYGYIKVRPKSLCPKSEVYKIDKFIEKPHLDKARKLYRDKSCYWNAGIFIFSPSLILEEIRKFMPGAYKAITMASNKSNLSALWDDLPSISIDYAIMEKTKRMALLPADCGWNDVGSWEAITEVLKKDKNGNIFRGEHLDIKSKDTLVWQDTRLIATAGLENIIIVDTPDALLVCRGDMSQEVRKIVSLLKKKDQGLRT